MWRRLVGVFIVSMLVLGPALLMSTLEIWTAGFSDAASDGVDQAAGEMSALSPPVVAPDLPVRTAVQLSPSMDGGPAIDVAPSALCTRAPPGSRSRTAV